MLTPPPSFKGKEIRLIGIAGKIGSGKTTLAKEIQRRHPEFIRFSFAENLRRMVALMIGMDVDKTRTTEEKAHFLKDWNMTVGTLLQRFGTEVARQIHPDAWILSSFATYKPDSEWRIYDDVRFENEARAIKERGGLLIRLEGDPGHYYEEAGLARNLQHASETALDHYDAYDLVINTNDHVNAIEALYSCIFDPVSL